MMGPRQGTWLSAAPSRSLRQSGASSGPEDCPARKNFPAGPGRTQRVVMAALSRRGRTISSSRTLPVAGTGRWKRNSTW